MAVFYSFHYERDVNRVQLIRNMGLVEGQRILNAQKWESVRARGKSAIQNWIDEQMKSKSAVVVLIGAKTASRTWVQYEVRKAWYDKKPLLGIRIHGLSSMGQVDCPGTDPFTEIPGYEGRNPGLEIFDPTVKDSTGAIDSQATFKKLEDNIRDWTTRGLVRKH